MTDTMTRIARYTHAMIHNEREGDTERDGPRGSTTPPQISKRERNHQTIKQTKQTNQQKKMEIIIIIIIKERRKWTTTPGRTLPSLRWRTSSSRPAVRSFCTEANPDGWNKCASAGATSPCPLSRCKSAAVRCSLLAQPIKNVSR